MPTDWRDIVQDIQTGRTREREAILRDIGDGEIVIDVGCRVGGWVTPILNTSWLNRDIVMIGIDPIAHDPCKELFDHYVNVAIGPKDLDKIPYYVVPSEPGCNSLLEPSEGLRALGRIPKDEMATVPQRRLDSVLKSLDIPVATNKIYYLKTDCQGADLAAIKSMGPYLQHTKYIEMEVGLDPVNPMYKGQDDIDAVVAELSAMGFDLIETLCFLASPLPEGELFFKKARV